MHMRRAAAGGLAILILAAGGFFTGAWASASSGYSTWITFSTSGTTLCGQDRAITGDAPYGPGPAAWGYERALDSGCSSSHTRPAGYYGTFATLLRDSGTVCGTTGWYYNTSTVTYTYVGYADSVCDNPDNYRARSKGREWDSDSDTYHTDAYYIYSPYWSYY